MESEVIRGPGSIPPGGNIFNIFYNTNLHNIARSDRVGFKTKNPTEVQTYSVNLCCFLYLNFLFYQNPRKVRFRLSGIKCNRVIDGVCRE